MVTPKFNWFISAEMPSANLKTGTTMQIVDLKSKDMSAYMHLNNPTSKEHLPWIQLFDSGARMSIDSLDWRFWNGCVFVDIDSKNYANKDNLDKIYDNIDNLIDVSVYNLSSKNETKNNFYFAQKTVNKGIHYMFFYDVQENEKNETTFKKCAQHAMQNVVNELKELMTFGEEFCACPKVVDNCSNCPTQGLYMSGNPLIYNSWLDVPHVIEFGAVPELGEIKKSKSKSNNQNKDIKINTSLAKTYDHNMQSNVVWGKLECWHFASILSAAYGPEGYEQAYNIFNSYMPLFKKTRKSSVRAIQSEFRTNYNRPFNLAGAYKNVLKFCVDVVGLTIFYNNDNNEAIEKVIDAKIRLADLVRRINADKTQTQIDSLPFDPDYTYNLAKGEYISNYAEEIDNLKSDAHTKLVYINADCGTGKTYYIVEQFIKAKQAIIVTHLNSIKSSNYVARLQREGIEFTTPTVKEIRNSNYKPSNKMVVGWNQFGELLRSKHGLGFYRVFIDEAHAITSTITYRLSEKGGLSDIIKLLSTKCADVTLVSATPHAEARYLFDNQMIKVAFRTATPYKLTTVYIHDTSANQARTVATMIKHKVQELIAMNDFNNNDNKIQIAIYDNVNHNKYETLLKDCGSLLHLYRDGREDAEIKSALNNQEYQHNILTSTAFGCEGIEYKQDVEDLIVLIPCYSAVLCSDVIQFINRWRNKKHVWLAFFETASLTVDVELADKVKDLLLAYSADSDAVKGIYDEIDSDYLRRGTFLNFADSHPFNNIRLIRAVIASWNLRVMESIKSFENISNYFGQVPQIWTEYPDSEIKSTDMTEINQFFSDNIEEMMTKSASRRNCLNVLEKFVAEKNAALQYGASAEQLFSCLTMTNYDYKDAQITQHEQLCHIATLLRYCRRVMLEFGIEGANDEEANIDMHPVDAKRIKDYLKFFTKTEHGKNIINLSAAVGLIDDVRLSEGAISGRQLEEQKQHAKRLKKVLDIIGCKEINDITKIEWGRFKSIYVQTGRLKGDRVGKAVKDKWCLISDNNVKFGTIEQMAEWMKNNGYADKVNDSLKKHWQRLNLFMKL